MFPRMFELAWLNLMLASKREKWRISVSVLASLLSCRRFSIKRLTRTGGYSLASAVENNAQNYHEHHCLEKWKEDIGAGSGANLGYILSGSDLEGNKKTGTGLAIFCHQHLTEVNR